VSRRTARKERSVAVEGEAHKGNRSRSRRGASERTPDEGIVSRVPWAVKAARSVMRGLAFLTVKQKKVLAALSFVTIPAIVSHAQLAVDRWWFLYVLLGLLFLLALTINSVIDALGYRALYGRPVFGAYGGVPERVLKAEIRCAADLSIELPEDDAKNTVELTLFSEGLVKASAKNTYLETHAADTDADPVEQRWEEYWGRVTTTPIGGSTYQAILAKYPLDLALVPGWLYRSTLLIPPVAIYVACMVALSLIAQYVQDILPILLEVSVLFGLLCSVFVVFIAGTRRGETVSLSQPELVFEGIDKLTQLSQYERNELRARAKRLEGRQARMMDVRMGPHCRWGLVRFFGHQLLLLLTSNWLIAIMSMAVCFAAAAPLTNQLGSLAQAYKGQAVLITQLLAAAFVGYYFWSVLLMLSGDIIGVVVGAATGARWCRQRSSLRPVTRISMCARLALQWWPA
jgi:hypothetical protein